MRNPNRLLGVVPGLLIVVLAASGLPTPAAGGEPVPMRRTCKRLDKQIARYEGVVEMAKARRDWAWYDASRAHVERLTDRRPKICPEQVAEEKREYFRRGARAARQMVKFASDAAIRYFTAGAM